MSVLPETMLPPPFDPAQAPAAAFKAKRCLASAMHVVAQRLCRVRPLCCEVEFPASTRVAAPTVPADHDTADTAFYQDYAIQVRARGGSRFSHFGRLGR